MLLQQKTSCFWAESISSSLETYVLGCSSHNFFCLLQWNHLLGVNALQTKATHVSGPETLQAACLGQIVAQIQMRGFGTPRMYTGKEIAQLQFFGF